MILNKIPMPFKNTIYKNESKQVDSIIQIGYYNFLYGKLVVGFDTSCAAICRYDVGINIMD